MQPPTPPSPTFQHLLIVSTTVAKRMLGDLISSVLPIAESGNTNRDPNMLSFLTDR